MERRAFLQGLGTMACSAAAHPLMSTVTLAQGQGLGPNRLVVVILRGGMDGLDVVRPIGARNYGLLRPYSTPGALPLEGQFALHPSLDGLMGLWQAGQLGFVHATSTPYRDKRSHFDGQIMLESGTGMDVVKGGVRDGWLNRMLQAVPGLQSETAYAIGSEALPLLQGAGPSLSWTPEVQLSLSAQSKLLLDAVYHDDDLFRENAAEAIEISESLTEAQMSDEQALPEAGEGSGQMAPAPSMRGVDDLVDFAAGRLSGATRIAAFSLSGWDTHRGQANAIKRPLGQLQRTILRLQDQLGPDVWARTTLVAMTEFGRTARENGTGGTDHGTGGLMVMAGGALRGGKVYGKWPGLAEADLYDRRDLLPTSDVRSWSAWAMRGLYGLDKSLLETAVFPGLDMGDDPRIIA
jgi:uncharacterized protein (DUF1501 family)